jgi:hypothetical protein
MKKILLGLVTFLLVTACTAQAAEEVEHSFMWQLTLLNGMDRETYILREDKFGYDKYGHLVVDDGKGGFVWGGTFQLRPLDKVIKQ